MKTIKPNQTAFIFDMDGTIVDNMGYHNKAWQKFFAGLGMTLTLEEIQRLTYGKNNREILRGIFGDHLTDDDVREQGERKETMYREVYQPVMKPVDGLLEFLNESKRLNIPLAVATAAGQPNIDFVMNNLNLESYFDTIVSAENVKRGKPHPDLFLAAAQKLNVAPESCLVFEDALAGIEAAHRAEMKAIAITTTYEAHHFESLPAVKRVIEDFTEVSPSDVLNGVAHT
ncbi:MAG: HAD family phosphatase [Chloroflexi bacterium]|nr:HAD family phosphatase [Chloroflexota bacterium]